MSIALANTSANPPPAPTVCRRRSGLFSGVSVFLRSVLAARRSLAENGLPSLELSLVGGGLPRFPLEGVGLRGGGSLGGGGAKVAPTGGGGGAGMYLPTGGGGGGGMLWPMGGGGGAGMFLPTGGGGETGVGFISGSGGRAALPRKCVCGPATGSLVAVGTPLPSSFSLRSTLSSYSTTALRFLSL